MTKPANFPARQDARRQAALSRLGKTAIVNAEALRIMVNMSAWGRATRTKKLRGQRRQAT